MKLSPPWVNYYNELKALFEQDPEITIKFDEEAPKISLYVENGRKADALTQLLPVEKDFGNVKLEIEVVPANNAATTLSLIEDAFYGNPALSYVYSADTPMGEINYVVFEGKIIQYFNDDLSDINGNKTTLYQEIAKDVFGEETGLYFCTEALNAKVSKPLGEWP